MSHNHLSHHSFNPGHSYSNRQRWLTLLLALPVMISLACNIPLLQPQNTSYDPGDVLPHPELPRAAITFRVTVPANTPPGETIYLSLLDEVTGLALNATDLTMEEAHTPSGGPRTYSLTLPLPVNAEIQYRYERQATAVRVIEHVSDGRPVRYRIYHIDGPGTVEDVVSRWTDTAFESPTGRIHGQAIDGTSGQPVPGLLVTAGGLQVITTADGTYLLEGLPPGVHNLVAYAMDGTYQTFQQGARVAPQSTTPALLKLEPAALVEVTFVANLPTGTPPVVPVRLAGNLYQLGNSFGSLAGGINGVATSMPVLTRLPDGRYTLTLNLPAGAYLRYKYTLGDGFWNAEHRTTGEFALREIIIPESDLLVEDAVETWNSGRPGSLTFDISVPANTPPGDFVSLQLNPGFGWTEPIPMWSLGGNRWAYVLYSPLNLPAGLSYRLCRNSQCDTAGTTDTAGPADSGRLVELGPEAQTVKAEVTGWAWLDGVPAPITIPAVDIQPRGPAFMAGIEFQASYHPSWQALTPAALDDVQRLKANWLVLRPTWTFTRNAPPVIEPLPGQDALWASLQDSLAQARSRSLNTAIYPTPGFNIPVDEWWQSAPRDFSWWLVWFAHYRTFLMHHADLAARSQANALVLGGEWLAPALPGGLLADGALSGVPADGEARWRSLLAEVRGRYNGQLLWAMPTGAAPPPFLDAVDALYVLWPADTFEQPGADPATLEAQAAAVLDGTLQPLQTAVGKPVILSIAYPSADGGAADATMPDMQEQVDAYHALLAAANQRDWIAGLVAAGYYPPAALQDPSISVHGKPTSDLLGYWFTQLLSIPSP